VRAGAGRSHAWPGVRPRCWAHGSRTAPGRAEHGNARMAHGGRRVHAALQRLGASGSGTPTGRPGAGGVGAWRCARAPAQGPHGQGREMGSSIATGRCVAVAMARQPRRGSHAEQRGTRPPLGGEGAQTEPGTVPRAGQAWGGARAVVPSPLSDAESTHVPDPG
jgi:hypothetical protein